MNSNIISTLHAIFKSTFLLLLISFFIFSCSVEKRIYQKGYYLVWKKKSQNIFVNDRINTTTSKKNIAAIRSENKRKLPTHPESISTVNYSSSIINSNKDDEQLVFVNHEKNSKHGPGNFTIVIPLQKDGKSKKFNDNFLAVEDTVPLKVKQNKEIYVKKLTNTSYIFGIFSIIFTLTIFINLILGTLAVIFGIMAIKKGGLAIMLMKNDSVLKDKYRKKAILGMKQGKFTLLFLHTLFFLGIISITIYFGFLILIYGIPLGLFPKYFIILGFLLLLFLTWLFFLLRDKIKNYYNSKIDSN